MTAENKQIVVLAGYSAAGKSTLGREMGTNWDYHLVEHQPLVHDIATSKGYKRARHWLAEVGVEKFANESVNKMVEEANSAFNHGEDKLVFDVSYGKEMIETLQSEFPDICILIVNVLADDHLRTKEIQKRMKTPEISIAEKELHFRDAFLSEVGLDEVLAQSNIKVVNDRTRTIGEVANELNSLIEDFLHKQ